MSAPRAQPDIPREGAVKDVDVLPRLACALARQEWSGQLHVRSGDVERRLYFVDGNLQTATSNDPSESLVAWLVEAGAAAAADVERAANHVGNRDGGLSFARQLVELGLVSSQQLADAELRRVVHLAETILSLRSGVYRCEVGSPPTEMISHALDLPSLVATSVLGRWEDTWAMNVLGGMGAVLKLNTERLPEYEATGADEAYDLTLLRVDGRSPLSEVLQRSPLPELAAVKFLAACRLLGIIEPAAASAAEQVPPREPAAAREPAVAPASPPPEAQPEAPPPAPPATEDDGDQTTPGFYRPQVRAPAPRAPEPLMSEPSASPGIGRWLLIALVLGLLGAVAWFSWIGLSNLPGDAPAAAGEAAP